MEINSGCLGTAGKTIEFDLFCLSDICRQNRFLFITLIIVIIVFYDQSTLSLAFFRQHLSDLFPFLVLS